MIAKYGKNLGKTPTAAKAAPPLPSIGASGSLIIIIIIMIMIIMVGADDHDNEDDEYCVDDVSNGVHWMRTSPSLLRSTIRAIHHGHHSDHHCQLE